MGGGGLFTFLFFLAPVEATLTKSPICQAPGVPPNVPLKSAADTDGVLLVPVPAESKIPVSNTTASPSATALAVRLLPLS